MYHRAIISNSTSYHYAYFTLDIVGLGNNSSYTYESCEVVEVGIVPCKLLKPKFLQTHIHATVSDECQISIMWTSEFDYKCFFLSVSSHIKVLH